MSFRDHEVYPLYLKLWQDARTVIASNQVKIDAVLASRAPDRRRGISVLARPSADVRERIERFVAPLRQVEPRQHYHQPGELHITVLSLFTATEQHAPYFARAAEYVEAVRHAMRNARPLTIAFEGITASRGVVMVQGFPADGALAAMRDSLRTVMTNAGLGADLDQRYRVCAAHVRLPGDASGDAVRHLYDRTGRDIRPRLVHVAGYIRPAGHARARGAVRASGETGGAPLPDR